MGQRPDRDCSAAIGKIMLRRTDGSCIPPCRCPNVVASVNSKDAFTSLTERAAKGVCRGHIDEATFDNADQIADALIRLIEGTPPLRGPSLHLPGSV